jgi:hypothetical protein
VLSLRLAIALLASDSAAEYQSTHTYAALVLLPFGKGDSRLFSERPGGCTQVFVIKEQ